MKNNIIFVFMYFVILLSLYSQNRDEFYVETINDDFIGVYLPNEYIDIGLFINGGDYLFYRLSRRDDFYRKSNLIFSYNLNEDKNIIWALSGIEEKPEIYEDTLSLDILTENDKRIVINTMFALNGYSFTTEQWKPRNTPQLKNPDP